MNSACLIADVQAKGYAVKYGLRDLMAFSISLFSRDLR
jgi:hypothetical protein